MDDLKLIKESADKIKEEIKKVVLGIDRAIDLLIVAIFSRGHVLLEGPPGQAKTTMLLALSRAINGRFERFQGLPDTMPSDILYATDISSNGKIKFSYGNIVEHSEDVGVVLIDEINRFQSKTQAVFLEAMQERRMTTGKKIAKLPHVIFVATRNPLEKKETYELPAAQRDRFLMEIEISYPREAEEKRIFSDPSFNNMESLVTTVNPVINLPQIKDAAEIIQKQIKISDAIVNYVHRIVIATRDPWKYKILDRSQNENDNEWLRAGISTRGGMMLLAAAKTAACLRGSDTVTPEDIQGIMNEVLAHRIFVQPSAEMRRSKSVKSLLLTIKDTILARS